MTDGLVPAVEARAPEGAATENGTDQSPILVADSAERDDEVLVLRERSRSFASIARASASRGLARPMRHSTGRCGACRPPNRRACAATRWRGWTPWANGYARGRTSISGNGSSGPHPRPPPQEAERLARRPARQEARCRMSVVHLWASRAFLLARPLVATGAVPEVASVQPTETEQLVLSTLPGADPSTIGFAELGVPDVRVEVLRRRGITHPLPIQAAAIADALAGHDVSGMAPTGSGKTLAFALPIAATLHSQ